MPLLSFPRQCRPHYYSYMLLIAVTLLATYNKVESLTIPDSIRVDRHGNPRLATVVGKTIGLGTRFALLARSADKIAVQVQAKSNREILRGNLQSLRVHVDKSRGPFLKVESLRVKASSLSLGWWPLTLASLPLAALKFRPPILLMWLCYWFYRSETYQQLFRSNKASSTSGSFGLKSIRKCLDGSPCSLDYQISLTEDNVNKSSLIQFLLNSVLRSIMLNSVLGVAAAAGDTITLMQNEIENSSPNQNINSKRNPNISLQRLNPSKSNDNLSKTPTPNNSLQQLRGDNNNNNTPRQQASGKQEPMLTKLLEATDFSLKSTNLTRDGRLLFHAEATTGDQPPTKFSYTLRVTPSSMVMEDQTHAVSFANPECQFAPGVLVGPALERFVPKLWIPVGPGVAWPLGHSQELVKVGITKTSSFEISGRLLLFHKQKGKASEEESFLLPSATDTFLLPPSAKDKE